MTLTFGQAVAMKRLATRTGEAAQPYTPAVLFASGEDGVWLEAGYGAFQTVGAQALSGTGNPVGFLLDRAQGAAYDGGFSGLGATVEDGFSDWVNNFGGAWTIGASSMSLAESADGSYAEPPDHSSTPLPEGFYLAEFTVSEAGNLSFNSGGASIYPSNLTAGSYAYLLYSDGTRRFRLNGTGPVTVSGFTIKELPGLHAYQSTSAARPTRGANPSRLIDDEVDDTLNWTAPADNFTISYVNSAETVTTLTSQALSGATDILLAADLVAYVAINRALTVGEQAQLDSYLEGLV